MSRKAGSVPEETKMRLIESAIQEFAAYGFQKASLRRICTQAEVTTGALYFFFQDKEDLFRSILSPVTDRILSLMEAHYKAELASPSELLAKDESEDFRAAEEFLELYYSHQTLCSLILNNRDHPVVTAFFDQLTELMGEQTDLLLKQFQPVLPEDHMFNDCTIHWISHLQIDSVMHILSHGFDETRAKEQLKIMVRFLRGGFFSLLPRGDGET